MDIVIIGPVYPYRGGIAHFTTLLARALAKRHVTRVVSFRRQYPAWLYPGASDRDPSQQPLRVEAEYLLDPLYPWTWWKAAQRIAALEPDAVIFQWWITFWGPAYAALAYLLHRRGIRLLFVIHNLMPHEARPWDGWLARLALRYGHNFLVQTEREKDRLLALLPHAAWTIVPHPVYDMFAGGRIPTSEARRRLGLPETASVALFFGIVRPYKGLRYLFEAIGKLRQRGKTIHLVVAGEFWEDAADYQQLAESLGISEQIKIEARYIPNEEIGLYFSAADVFAAPYVDGTQSGAVKMALGFGLPVIISRAITSDELANDRTHRLYWVDSKNADDLANEIAHCLDDNRTAAPAGAVGGTPDEWETLVEKIEAIISPAMD